MRLVFMGTPDFAVTTLEALHSAGHEIELVVTQPDRPKGRGHNLAFSPVKQAALALGLEIEQPEKVRERDFVDKLKAIAPDVIVVVAFGQILSEDILAIPKYGCVNLHASLLPKYRGAAPIHMAVVNGESVTGNTTMLMDKGMDTGAMLLQNEVEITGKMTTGELHDKLAASGAQLMIKTLAALERGTVKPEKQDDALATYAGKLDREIEIIDWSKTSQEIFNKIRGLNPWPVAYTTLRGNRLKVLAAALVQGDMRENQAAGSFIKRTQNGFLVAAGDGALEILQVQPASKKAMPAKDFISGLNISDGEIVFGRSSDGQ